MPKIKLVLSLESYDDDALQAVLSKGISDWEEISDEDLNFLRSHLYLIKRPTYGDYKVNIVVQDPTPVSEYIDSIKECLDNIRKQESLAEERRKADNLKRQQKKLLKKKKTEMELLEELKKKYEPTSRS